MISAEIEPAAGRAKEAALALQRAGFRVLHIGPTISVQGSEDQWSSMFNVSFETRKKAPSPGREGTGDSSFRKANTERIKIPGDLQYLIKNVMFAEPPEFY